MAKPWCECLNAGRGSGYRLNPATGYWVHSECNKPARMVYEKIQAGEIKPQRVKQRRK